MTDRQFRVRDLRNGEWFWIHKKALEIIGKELGARGVEVYNWLSCFANNSDQRCYPSISLLAVKCKISARSVKRIIKQLEELRVISIKREPGRKNIYTLLKHVEFVTGDTRDPGSSDTRDPRTILREKELSDNIYAAHLKILFQIKNYPYQLENDSEMLERLSERHSLSSLELLQVLHDYSIAKLDKPLRQGDNPRSQINTFCKNHRKWHSEKNDDSKLKKGLIANLK